MGKWFKKLKKNNIRNICLGKQRGPWALWFFFMLTNTVSQTGKIMSAMRERGRERPTEKERDRQRQTESEREREKYVLA